MLEVQKFIKDKGVGALTTELGIKVREYEEGLLVLNYDQIESPKSHPVVMECRSLILDRDTYDVVSISFDRFFNHGEVPDETGQVDFSRAYVFEKADGSLIKVYYCMRTDRWEISTRSLAFAEGEHVAGGTFRDRVLNAMGFSGFAAEVAFQTYCSENLNPHYTFVMEYTGPENRIVTRYENPEMVLLSIRANFWPHREVHGGELDLACEDMVAAGMNIRMPKMYDVSSADAALAAANELGGLQEGFVVFDPVSKKRCKVKSPAYVAVHHLRDNGVLSPRRVAELVLLGEEEEYLTYFPEDRGVFQPIVDKRGVLMQNIIEAHEKHKDIEDQKEYALAVKDYKFSGVLFAARKKNADPIHCFNDSLLSKRVELLLSTQTI